MTFVLLCCAILGCQNGKESKITKKLTLDDILYLKTFDGKTETEIWDQLSRYGADIPDNSTTYQRLRAKGFSIDFLEKLQAFLKKATKAPQWKPLPNALVEAAQKERLPQAMAGADTSWAVVLGINDYRYNTPGLLDLQFAVNDAWAFAQYLLGLGIPQEHIYLLVNEDATKEKLSNVLQEIKSTMAEKSTMYMYFSGHGAMYQDVGYFLMHDTMGTEEELSKTGYPMNQLKAELGNLQAKKLLLFLDACHSAGMNGLETFNPKRTSLTRKEEKPASAEPMPPVAGTMQDQPTIMVLASSQANQISAERKGNGIFTSYLLEGLKGKADRNQDRLVTIDEAYRYLVANVEIQLPSVDFSPNWDQAFGIPCIITTPPEPTEPVKPPEPNVEPVEPNIAKVEPVKPMSTSKWTFQSAEMQDESKKAKDQFEVGQAMYVKVTWSTQQIPPGSRDEITLSGALIQSINKTISKSKVGRNWTYSLPVELLEQVAGEYEIEVELKIGGASQKKQLTFTVIEPTIKAEDIAINITGDETLEYQTAGNYKITVTNTNEKTEDEFKIEIRLNGLSQQGIEDRVWSTVALIKPQEQWTKIYNLTASKLGIGKIIVNVSFTVSEEVLTSETKEIEITTTLDNAANQRKLVGMWSTQPADNLIAMKIEPDGTFLEIILGPDKKELSRSTGKLRIINDQKLMVEMETPKVIDFECRYRVQANSLELLITGQWITYQRIELDSSAPEPNSTGPAALQQRLVGLWGLKQTINGVEALVGLKIDAQGNYVEITIGPNKEELSRNSGKITVISSSKLLIQMQTPQSRKFECQFRLSATMLEIYVNRDWLKYQKIE